MISSGNPGTVEDYPILILTFRGDPSVPQDIVGEPGKLNDEQGIRYVFIIAGYTYVFHVSKHNITAFVLDCTINPTGEMKVLHTPRGEGLDLLFGYFGLKRRM